MTISTAWLKDLSADEQKVFKSLITTYHKDQILLKLKKIVEEKRLSLEASERNPEIYNNANWPYMQAHNNGANQTLKWVESLLAFTE